MQNLKNSQTFSGSGVYIQLLDYLYQHYKQGKIPKETSIAIDVFNRESTFDSATDTIVRVHMHKLRKKIEHYYLTEGKNEECILTIPKGHYQLKFIKSASSVKKSLLTSSRKTIFTLTFSAIILFIFAFILYQTHTKKKDPYIKLKSTNTWFRFIDSDRPVMIVLGDYFFFSMTSKADSLQLVARDFNINNQNEFEQFKDKMKDGREINELDYTYLGHFTAYSLNNILPVFYKNGKDVEVRLISRFRVEDLSKYNIVFIGLYKTLGPFYNILNYSNARVDIDEGKVQFKNKLIDSIDIYNQRGIPEAMHNDFGLIAKVPGPVKNEVIIISAFHDIGLIECSKNIISPSQHKLIETKLAKKYQNAPLYYEAFYKINGVDRTSINSNLIHVNGFSRSLNIWEIGQD